jgi:DNA-directed RNA polymerase subunit RPC12/RpoP
METYPIKPAVCPKCGSSRIVDVDSGPPEIDDQVGSDIQSGQVVLGGCGSLPGGPSWICADCEREFYKPNRRR